MKNYIAFKSLKTKNYIVFKSLKTKKEEGAYL